MLPALELRIENVQGVMNINLSNEDIFILADKIHLTNVLDNLIDNAIKYSINNPVIYISSSIQKGKVILSIEDNGVGMDIVTQKKSFKSFTGTTQATCMM